MKKFILLSLSLLLVGCSSKVATISDGYETQIKSLEDKIRTIEKEKDNLNSLNKDLSDKIKNLQTKNTTSSKLSDAEVKHLKSLIKERDVKIAKLKEEHESVYDESLIISGSYWSRFEVDYEYTSSDGNITSLIAKDTSSDTNIAITFNRANNELSMLNGYALSNFFWSPDHNSFILDAGTYIERGGGLYLSDSEYEIASLSYSRSPYWIDNKRVVFATKNDDIKLDHMDEPSETYDVAMFDLTTGITKTLLHGTDQFYYTINNIKNNDIIICTRHYVGSKMDGKEDELISINVKSEE